ncbi:unnamed protein product [Ranitomeya imitator]|uniref:DDE Tnp4 domain-containing protein n=1 Tax=Ranitomeya imitator TaxID=111125 RepID=A0ABN9LP64_9NEOB|nr:unnamed protein product [Ranitomeya imitator]
MAKWQGAYEVQGKVGEVNYRVYQPGKRKPEQLYHINLLKVWKIRKIPPMSVRTEAEGEFPKTADDWKRIASDFDELWQFPNCGGALDGKHVRITQPANSGSFFFNYKGYFSVILMALVNANYEFVDVDVGMNGRVSDGGVFKHTSFGESLRNNELLLPLNEDTKANLNFVFIADEAFPLHPHLLKPFAQRTLTQERRIFNYRLSRAFGIMANRFRVFHTAINLKLPSIDFVVLACCVLHNFLRRHDTSSYSPPSFIDAVDARTGDIVPGEWRTQPDNFTALQALDLADRQTMQGTVAKNTVSTLMVLELYPGRIAPYKKKFFFALLSYKPL